MPDAFTKLKTVKFDSFPDENVYIKPFPSVEIIKISQISNSSAEIIPQIFGSLKELKVDYFAATNISNKRFYINLEKFECRSVADNSEKLFEILYNARNLVAVDVLKSIFVQIFCAIMFFHYIFNILANVDSEKLVKAPKNESFDFISQLGSIFAEILSFSLKIIHFVLALYFLMAFLFLHYECWLVYSCYSDINWPYSNSFWIESIVWKHVYRKGV